MTTDTHVEESIADRVKQALRGGGFLLYSQTIRALAPRANERPLREILIRFREEEEKMLPPGTFFPILEESGLLPELDRWVVSYLVKRSYATQTERPDVVLPRNSINLAADSLQDAKFTSHALKRVTDARLPQGTISFEISWGAASEYAALVQELMAQLRPAGCTFCIAGFDGSEDAFGIVRVLRPEFIKLNYGLVQHLGRTLADSELAETVAARCREMGIQTIAEYVESNLILDHLKLIGVDYAQGLAISPPKAL